MPQDRDRTLAVTALDTWRRWLAPDEIAFKEGAGLTELRAALLERTASDAMHAGTAGHRLLELLGAGTLGDIRHAAPSRGGASGSFGQVLDFGDIFGEADELEPEVPDTLDHGAYVTVPITDRDGTTREVDLTIEIAELATVQLLPIAEARVEKTYDTPVGPVRVKGRIDGSDGIEILDLKFTGKPDFEELEAGWQWKVYLDATGAQRFRWEVFTMKPPLKSELAWRVQKVQTLRQYRYPSLGADVARAVSQFAVLIDRFIPEYWDRASRAGDAAVPVEE